MSLRESYKVARLKESILRAAARASAAARAADSREHDIEKVAKFTAMYVKSPSGRQTDKLDAKRAADAHVLVLEAAREAKDIAASISPVVARSSKYTVSDLEAVKRDAMEAEDIAKDAGSAAAYVEEVFIALKNGEPLPALPPLPAPPAPPSAVINVGVPADISIRKSVMFPDAYPESRDAFNFDRGSHYRLGVDAEKPVEGKHMAQLIGPAARQLPNVPGAFVSVETAEPKSFIKQINVSKVKQGGMNPVEKIVKAASRLVKTAVGGRRRRVALKKTRKVARRR